MLYFTPSKLSENIALTPEGYLVCTGVSIGRTGEMEYAAGETPLEVGPDGRVLISRDASELFKPEAIASFEGKSITIQHPKDWVAPENWRELTHGMMKNVRRGDGETANDLLADVFITDVRAIELVKSGLREVSCGYEAEYIQTGIGRGVQKNIVGNHLALVQEGRAGSAYAIKDHKGERMKLADKVKALFGKAQDDALKLIDEEHKGAKAADSAGGQPTEANQSYDALMKKMDGIAAMLGEKKAGDASTPPEQGAPAKVEAVDAAELKASLDAIMGRLDKLEGKSTGDEESDEITDEEGDEEESEDDDFEESEMTGDSAELLALDDETRSRIEIIAPGFKPAKGEKNPKAAALKAAYATTDGKKVIDGFTGGKAPALDNAVAVDVMIKASSEIMKRDRSSQLGRTKTRDFSSVLEDHSAGSKVMTAEKMNENNAKHYASAKH